MRTYSRPNSRFAPESEPGGPPRSSVRRDSFPVFWGRFVERMERALESGDKADRKALQGILLCGGRELSRLYRCGQEESAFGAWCGHDYCPACAQQRGAEVARFAAETWDERVVWVGMRMGSGAGGPELPSREAVAQLRAAWSDVSKRAAELTHMSPVDAAPRAVVAPGTLHLFARLPWDQAKEGMASIAEDTLITGIRRAAREQGIVGLQARVVSREAAGWQLREALGEESRRFLDAVGYDLARTSALRWRGDYAQDASQHAHEQAAARRWIEALRNAPRRRQRILGGRDALPAPPSTGVCESKGVCPRHGAQCVVDETRIRRTRDRGILERIPGDQIPASNRIAIARALAKAPAEPPPSLGQIRWRRAG